MNHIFDFLVTSHNNTFKLSGTWEYMAGMMAAIYHIDMYNGNSNSYKLILSNGTSITNSIISDYKTDLVNKSGWVICRSEEDSNPKKFWKYHCDTRDFIDGFRKMEKLNNQVDAQTKNGKMISGIMFISKNGIPIVNYDGIFGDWVTYSN